MAPFFRIGKPRKKKPEGEKSPQTALHGAGKVALTTLESEIRARLSALGYTSPHARRGTKYTGEQLAEMEIRPIFSELLGLKGEVKNAFEKVMDERTKTEQALLVKALPAGDVMKLIKAGSGIKDPFLRGGIAGLVADTQLIMVDSGRLKLGKRRRTPSGTERIPG